MCVDAVVTVQLGTGACHRVYDWKMEEGDIFFKRVVVVDTLGRGGVVVGIGMGILFPILLILLNLLLHTQWLPMLVSPIGVEDKARHVIGMVESFLFKVVLKSRATPKPPVVAYPHA